jgi:small-conductance mechanosensitive channel
MAVLLCLGGAAALSQPAKPTGSANAPLPGVVAPPQPAALALPPASPAGTPNAATSVPALSAEQVARVLDVLKDDKKRADLIDTLQAIGKAVPTPESQPEKALPIPLAPNSLGAELLVEVSTWLSHVSNEVVSAASVATSVPSLWAWLITMATDPLARTSLLDMGWRLALVVGLSLLALLAARRLLRRGRAKLAEMAPPTAGAVLMPGTGRQISVPEEATVRIPIRVWLHRLPLTFGALLIDLIAVFCFALVGHLLVASAVGSTRLVRLVLLAAVNALVAYGIAMAAARALFAPGFAQLRLVPVDDAAAEYAVGWWRRLAAVGIGGYAIAEAGLLLGLSQAAHAGLLKLIGFAVSMLVAIIVLSNRGPLAKLIEPPPAARGPVAVARHRFAMIWHFLVAFYVMALWLVWALDLPNGFERLVRFFISTALIAAIGRVVGLAVTRAFDRWTASRGSPSRRAAGFDDRLSRYNSVMRAALNGSMMIVTAMIILQAWGVNSLGWLVSNGLGGRLVSAIATFALTVFGALLAWEIINSLIERHLARLSRDNQLARSARLRTLLPMIRTSLLIVMLVVIGFTLLSEIGVNIAPLLAGAGVIGLAIGFGSQKLVQDIITGMFLLLENTMQVGDVIELAGRSGVVENLSVRTIRLRDLDGSVHIIPFSAVTTVTNMTRDFGYAVVDVTMGQNQDPDRIADILREITRDMRSEGRWRSAIRDELEVLGVERFVDQGWVLRTRIRTQPNDRWAVGREFNRRVKYRFDQLGIDRPLPSYRVFGDLPVPTLSAPGPE